MSAHRLGHKGYWVDPGSYHDGFGRGQGRHNDGSGHYDVSHQMSSKPSQNQDHCSDQGRYADVSGHDLGWYHGGSIRDDISYQRSPKHSPYRGSQDNSPQHSPSGGRSRMDRSALRSPERYDSSNPGNTLHVKFYSSRVTEKDLEEHFSKEGKVSSCSIVGQPCLQNSCGFAFVTMDSVEDANRCVKNLNQTVLRGYCLTIEQSRRNRTRTPTPEHFLGPKVAKGCANYCEQGSYGDGSGRGQGKYHDSAGDELTIFLISILQGIHHATHPQEGRMLMDQDHQGVHHAKEAKVFRWKIWEEYISS